jgi:hypothetical protein
MATLKDGTITVAGRTSDGTKLNKVIYSPNKSLVGKFVDSENLNKWSLGGTPTFYGNSLGMASWQQTVATPPIPGATQTPAPSTSGGNYSVQSTSGSTTAPVGGGELATLEAKAAQLKAQVDKGLAGSGLTRQQYDALVTQMGDAQYAVNQYKQAHGIPLNGSMGPVAPPPPPGPVLTIEPGKGGMDGNVSLSTAEQMAAKIFPNDARAQQAFIKSWNEGLVYEQQGLRTRDATERAALLAGNQAMTNPLNWLNDFLTGHPVGQVLAPILENGAGVMTGVGSGSSTGTTVHTGMPAPTTTTTQPNWDSVIDQAVNNYTPPPTTINGGTTNSGTIVNGSNGPVPVLNNPTYTPAPGSPTASGSGTQAPTTSTSTATTGGGATPGTGGTTPAPTTPTTTSTPTTGAATTSALPSWFTPELAAIIASGGLGALTSNQAATTMANAQTEAARIQKEAADKAAQTQLDIFNQIRTDQTPWREAGTDALGKLGTFFTDNPDFGMAQFQADPGYSFRLSEGMKALQNSAAAKGNLLSGNTLKGITNYGQETASQEYNNAFNRYQTQRGQKLNHLQSLAGVGQSAVQQTGQAGQNYANNAGSAYINGANAQAAGVTGAADATASGWAGGANALNNALSTYLNYNQSQGYLNALRQGGY